MSKPVFISIVVSAVTVGVVLALVAHPLWLTASYVSLAVTIMVAIPDEDVDPTSPCPGWSTISIPRPNLWQKAALIFAVFVALCLVVHPAVPIVLSVFSAAAWFAIREIRDPSNSSPHNHNS